jgi:hypothetical protein
MFQPAMARFVLCLAMLLATAGCARLPVAGALPSGMAITRLDGVKGATAFAWHPGGAKVAVVAGNLAIVDTTGTGLGVLSHEKPDALSWAADGNRLAAAFPQGERTTLRIFHGQGTNTCKTTIDGHVTTIAWLNSEELLAGALTLEPHSFGIIVKEYLYRWNGTGKAAATFIGDTTVRPFIGKWPKQVLYRTFTFSLSPLGEEMVYTRLHDPPQFTPYLKVMIRNLHNGAEMEVATAAVGSGTPVYATDGESIIYEDGIYTQRVDPWQQRDLAMVPSPGRSIAISPGGKLLLTDGNLYSDGRSLAVFPPSSNGRFSPDGKNLLVLFEGRLYLVSGFQDGTIDSTGKQIKEQLLTLHRWRSEGLIGTTDYKAARERILNHDKTN